MNSSVLHPAVLLDWSVAARPVSGEAVSGDLHLVQPFERGVLGAVVDGVGHGDEATAASRAAVAVLEKNAHDPVIALVRRCHHALMQTRGAVMTVASLWRADNTLTWLGVGNVEGRLWRADRTASHPCESVLLRGGVVGYQLPALQASVIPVAPGDLLVLATDGVDNQFEAGFNPAEETPWYRVVGHKRSRNAGSVIVSLYREP